MKLKKASRKKIVSLRAFLDSFFFFGLFGHREKSIFVDFSRGKREFRALKWNFCSFLGSLKTEIRFFRGSRPNVDCWFKTVHLKEFLSGFSLNRRIYFISVKTGQWSKNFFFILRNFFWFGNCVWKFSCENWYDWIWKFGFSFIICFEFRCFEKLSTFTILFPFYNCRGQANLPKFTSLS